MQPANHENSQPPQDDKAPKAENPPPLDSIEAKNNEEDSIGEIQRTRNFTRQELEAIISAREGGSASGGVPKIGRGVIRVDLVDTRKSFTITLKPLILLGRPDPVLGQTPDIDFTELAGYRMGVSRRHAQITISDDHTVRLHDLGSSNGTYLNGERLKVNQPRPIYNGDEIRLGKLAMYVYYEIQSDRNLIPFRGVDED